MLFRDYDARKYLLMEFLVAPLDDYSGGGKPDVFYCEGFA